VTPEELVRGAVVVAIFLLIAFPVHEFSHAWAAYRLGDSTARYQGRLTLNPIAHFDPLGGTMLAISIMFLGFGFGWAKPTPVNPYNLRYGRRGEAIVALAGPISNLVMAIAVAIPLRIIQADAGLSAAVAGNGIASFAFDVGVTFVVVAVLLLVFNLLPIPPLDGGHILFALLEKAKGSPLSRATYERASFIGFALVLVVFVFALQNDIGRITGEGFNLGR
jgi:Zn-dependent protease